MEHKKPPKLIRLERRLRVGLKKSFITGLAALLPAVFTFYVIAQVIELINNALGKTINNWIQTQTGYAQGWIGFFIVLLLVLVVGFLLASFVGRRIFRFLESSLVHIPLIRHIYLFAKQIIDFFVEKKDMQYGQVVAIEYPRKGIYSLGFVTGNGLRTVVETASIELISVFIPSSPTPVTGYTIMVPASDAVFLDITAEDAIRFTVSGGVIVPGCEAIPLKPENRKETK